MQKNIFYISIITFILIPLFFSSCASGKYAVVEISTDYGEMTVALNEESKGLNDFFLNNIKSGIYDSSLFHRMIKDFVIQGGERAQSGDSNAVIYNTLIKDEPNNKINKRGAIALANINRDSSNAISGPGFYIVTGRKFSSSELGQIESYFGATYDEEQRGVYVETGGMPHLDGKFTVIGEVVKGIEVLDQIEAVETNDEDRPLQNISMTISIVKEPK
jgi:cyclophilin family peptidyl-prolyl cis-trans isomerase